MKQVKVKKEIQYRLYYAADGSVLTYSVEELPGNFIVITREQYAEARSDVIVANGKLIYTHANKQFWKLTKTQDPGVKTSKYDICILSEGGVNWGLKIRYLE